MTADLFLERARQWEAAELGDGVLRCHRVLAPAEWRDLCPSPHMTPECIATILASDDSEIRLWPARRAAP